VSIEAGRNLLHYRLIEKIGEGGMGVVWKAVDTTLDREVAIKILPDAFAAEPERLARFEREARVLASLNHPHIAGIYGIHEVPQADSGPAGMRFLAMEYVPGEDLSMLLARGPLPLERCLQIARDVAAAVETAHDSGVIHRDLKPANVRLTADGKAKVLDFGLAKAYDPATASDPARSQTVTSAGTVAGLILGTAAYMSPEQASGQPTDRRCDIWSFGVMLHEMLSGKRLFDGETVSHTLADVLRAPIDLDDLPGNVPPSIRRLVARCLDREKMRRLRDIGEARIAIEDAIANPSKEDGPVAPPGAARPASANRLPWVVASLAALLAVTAFVWRPGAPIASSTEPVRRFALEVPNSGNTRQGDGLSIAISSDGRNVITRGGTGAEDMLYMRSIDDFEPHPIEGTASGRNPLYSPDDRWVAFIDASGLRKARVTGGPSVYLAQFPSSPDGVEWATDNWIYYAHQGDLWRVSSDGGEAEHLYINGTDEGPDVAAPHLLPDGRTLLCNSRGGRGEPGELYTFDLETKRMKSLGMQGSDARYLPTGHIVFAQSDRVFVAPFELDALELTDTSTPVLDRVWVDQRTMQMDISDNGTVVYLPNTRGETQALVMVNLDGKVESLFPDGLPFRTLNDPRISRDGRRLMVSVDSGAIWMIDRDTQTPTLMTESGFYPLWSPDGTEMIFATSRNRTFDIYRVPVDLSRPESLLLDRDNNLRTADWTRQGDLIIREEIPGKGMDLHRWPDIGDPDSMTALMTGDDDELAPIVSPDGKWLAYVSNYSGTDEIYVTSFPVTGPRSKISLKGGTSPTWAPDGKTLYYFEGLTMIAVSIDTQPSFRVTGRKPLFTGDYVQYRWSRQYDILPDGSGFVLIRNPPRGNVEVVTRWFDELKRLRD